MSFFLTLRSVQTLLNPKVVDGIKIKLFEATTITKKIILEDGLIAVNDGSRSGSGSGVTVGANNASLTIFETTSHYNYDHIGCTNFSSDFATFSECSACKCQDCKAKHNGVINAINTLTAYVKKMTSKRGVIPSKIISYSYTPLEIKTAKGEGKILPRHHQALKKAKLQRLYLCLAPMFSVQRLQRAALAEEVEATAEEHNITVDNPSTTFKQEENVEPSKVFRNKECLINIIKGFCIRAGLPWHLVDEVYIPINCGDEFHWVLAVFILKERRTRVYDSMSQRRYSGPSSEIPKLAKILPTYLDMSDFLNQKVRTDWLMIEAYRDKMGNPFDVQYAKGIAQQTIDSLNYGLFIAVYAEYLSDVLQVPNDGLNTRLFRKRYASPLWKYGEVKAQKPYVSDIKDPQRPKPNSATPDEE
ncbi:hypothetical protein BC332_24042 [Capsicum chinense]|nr:hypothetical protein BC332_24042 [Capsicum chinense]